MGIGRKFEDAIARAEFAKASNSAKTAYHLHMVLMANPGEKRVEKAKQYAEELLFNSEN